LPALIFALALCAPAAGHHSQAFFAQEVFEYSGELTALDWRNPHVSMTLNVTNADSGQAEEWNFEFDSIYVLGRMGVRREDFPIGEQVRVAGRPSTISDADGLGLTMLRADGQEVLLFSFSSPRFSDQVIGRPYDAIDEQTLVDAAAENRGIFRVWSSPALGYHELNLPLREEAIAARAQFDMGDNFATRCETEGMPRLMRNPHPFEFIDAGAEIRILSELYEIERTIHMDVAEIPDNAQPSLLGYSVGRWEGSTLVVTTSRINWPYFDNIGTPQSDAVAIVERFALSDDQTRLDYHATVTDTQTFSAPATIEGYWLALGEAIGSYACVAY
jgi:hypothetical protein